MTQPRIVLVWSDDGADRPWVDALKVHIRPFERDGLCWWDPTRIDLGDDRASSYRAALTAARVAIVLVSTSLLADERTSRDVLGPLVDRAHRNEVRLIPVYLRPTNAGLAELGECRIPITRFQGVNAPDAPLLGMSQDAAERVFVTLVEYLHAALTPTPALASRSVPATATSASRLTLVVDLSRDGDVLTATHSLPGTAPLAPAFRHTPEILDLLDACTEQLDVAWPESLPRHLQKFEARIGPILLEALLGPATHWRPLLRTIYRTPADAPDPTPATRALTVRICTSDPHLAALPWRLMRWNERRLVSDGWRLHVVHDRSADSDHVTHPGDGICVLAPRGTATGSASSAVRHDEILQPVVARLWRDAPRGFWRTARSRADLMSALEGQLPRLLHIQAWAVNGEGTVRLLLDPPDGDHHDSISLSELARLFERTHRPDVVSLALDLHGPTPADVREAVHAALADVPLVVCARLQRTDTALSDSLRAWVEQWLSAVRAPGDPVDALHALGTGEEAVTHAATLLFTVSRYRSWRTDPPRAPKRPPAAHLKLNREKPKSQVAEQVLNLCSPDKRVLAIVGLGSLTDAIHFLSEQLAHHVEERTRDSAAIKLRDLDYPFATDLPQGDRFLNHLRLRLEPTSDEETEAQLLTRHAPRSSEPRRKPVLWLDWGEATDPAQIEPWVHFSTGRLAQVVGLCPPDRVRVVSFLAVPVAQDQCASLAKQVKAMQFGLSEPAAILRPVELEQYDAADILNYLAEHDCPIGMRARLAELVFDVSGSSYRRAVELLERGLATSWPELLDELRHAQRR